MTGFTVNVSPSSLTLNAGQSKSFNVTPRARPRGNAYIGANHVE
jgi:hypothetical protein